MNKMDNNKGTPSKETSRSNENYTDVEHGDRTEITEPKPSYTPNVFPDEMPARENK